MMNAVVSMLLAGGLATSLPVAPATAPVAGEGTPLAQPVAEMHVAQKTGDIEIVAIVKTDSGVMIESKGTGTITLSVKEKVQPGTTRAIENVDGGTWKHGSTFNIAGKKVCTSEFMHPNRNHGTSVEMDGNKASDWAGPGQLAYSRVSSWTTDTCRAWYRF